MELLLSLFAVISFVWAQDNSNMNMTMPTNGTTPAASNSTSNATAARKL
jgi:hypothetical protein